MVMRYRKGERCILGRYIYVESVWRMSLYSILFSSPWLTDEKRGGVILHFSMPEGKHRHLSLSLSTHGVDIKETQAPLQLCIDDHLSYPPWEDMDAQS